MQLISYLKTTCLILEFNHEKMVYNSTNFSLGQTSVVLEFEKIHIRSLDCFVLYRS
jgi:hypothetical protein